MASKPKGQLIEENAALRARLAQLERGLAERTPAPRAHAANESVDFSPAARLSRRPRTATPLPVPSSPTGSWDWDILTGQMTWSAELYRIFGLTPGSEEPTYELLLQQFHPDDRKLHEGSLRESLVTGAPFRTESRILCGDGSVTTVISQGEPQFGANNTPFRMAGTVENITERTRIERAMKASEIRYRGLFETAKDGILILDADTGTIADANPFLQELLGFSHTELLGKSLWEIGLFADIAASQDTFRRLQTQEYIRYENLPLETKAHQQKHVEFISNVYSVDGKPVIQCNVRDITDRKRAEDSSRKASDELLALVFELQRRDSQMKVLNRMNALLQACTTQEEVCKVIALMAGEVFVGQPGSLAITQASDQYLETVASWGDGKVLEDAFSLEDCWAMRRGQPHEVIDPAESLLCRHLVEHPKSGYLCVPLTVQGETLGLLCLMGVAGRASEHQVGQYQLGVSLGETIKLSLSNLRLRERLREQAVQDPLTGLFNRRYLENVLSRELHRARRANAELCVAMIDLDHFKGFNDSYGHDAGDALLREMGQLLREHLRKSDISCRYGGEEFVLVLPDSSLADTWERVEELRLLVKALRVQDREQELGGITMSGGVAGACGHGLTARELLRAADEALYAAKQGGRDRVVVYTPKE
jgi:diguanylate cyclase (GGDEF)-like protein/PAS domain S-box-containing protein